ncbi:hypothetical protein KL912_004108 [Ogataea haglerorum]|nr:hypothetical protein KL912_004108 [Ogataea haglerorum]KAG7786159.1 hypothetical protein KL945_003385 [Ogataea haglerorum]KAG7786345.1 hypothetical protein KL910_004192 [Ogataea haglerorum]
MEPDMACIGKKRFLDAGETAFRDTKRRLIENFTDLHIGRPGRYFEHRPIPSGEPRPSGGREGRPFERGPEQINHPERGGWPAPERAQRAIRSVCAQPGYPCQVLQSGDAHLFAIFGLQRPKRKD